MKRRRFVWGLGIGLLACGAPGAPVAAQQPDLRARVESVGAIPIDFEQPEVLRWDVGGVPVLALPDPALPLLTVHAYLRGGYGRFDRSHYAAASGLPALLRYGGTQTRTPSEVDEAIEGLALQLSFGSAGGSVTSTLNTLAENADAALELWGDMMANPGFDGVEIEAWRGRQLESVLRRVDDPARLAFSETNRLLYGDHPVGWEMEPADLEPARVSVERFDEVHARVFCRDNLTLGVTGSLDRSEIEPLLETLVQQLPLCSRPLPRAPDPSIRRAPGVFVVDRPLAQSVIVMAHATNVRLADAPRYYAAMVGNSVLGGGGFSSRILSRVRTEEGFAYSATSLWTTPARHEGIIAATTRTRPERTADAIDVMLGTMQELTEEPPTADEVQRTIDQFVSGFVFSFDSPGQVVARQMFYLAQGLPEDWLNRFWAGVQQVRPDDVLDVFHAEVDPSRMSIVVVGDAALIEDKLARFGPVQRIEIEGGR
ncbi:MAG: pitrilysin family protein [Gemmatimonadota bacterium]